MESRKKKAVGSMRMKKKKVFLKKLNIFHQLFSGAMDKALDYYIKRLSMPGFKHALKQLYTTSPTNPDGGITFVSITLSYLGERCKPWKDDFVLKKARIDTTAALKKSDLSELVADINEMHAHVAAATAGSFVVLLVLQQPGHTPESQVLLITP